MNQSHNIKKFVFQRKDFPCKRKVKSLRIEKEIALTNKLCFRVIYMKQIIAKMIRIVTIPPIMALTVLSLLFFAKETVYRSATDFMVAFVSLVLLPTLAYPLAATLPKYKEKGREGQRNMAFTMSVPGYALLAVYTIFAAISNAYRLISLTYVCSFLLLLFCNKVLKRRASGHACGITGPILIAAYFLGKPAMFGGLLMYLLIFRSSLITKRHTPKELVLGTICCMAGFFLSLLICR